MDDVRTIDKKAFYDLVREAPFGGRLTTLNFEGTDAILNYWLKYKYARNVRCLAYILATVFHETAGTMDWSIKEGGLGRGKKYGKPAGPHRQIYYGRSWPQLTWDFNYEKMGKLANMAGFTADIFKNPDALLEDKELAAFVLFEGMYKGDSGKGDFTGKALDDYFAGDQLSDEQEKAKAKEARHIINGTDKAEHIANHYMTFLKALNKTFKRSDAIPVESKKADEAGELPSAVSTGQPIAQTKSLWGTVANWAAGFSLTSVVGSMGGFFKAIDNPWSLAAVAVCVVAMGIGGYLVISGRLKIKREAGV